MDIKHNTANKNATRHLEDMANKFRDSFFLNFAPGPPGNAVTGILVDATTQSSHGKFGYAALNNSSLDHCVWSTLS